MSSGKWSDYFDSDPEEIIGRQLPGIFDVPRIVVLPRISWEYLDWLARTENRNVQKFLVDNELVWRPKYGPIQEFLKGAVRTAFLRRERSGSPRPPWLAPALPHEYADI